jgi:peptidoglycan hydrolase-like protein with peptidoglycan-binding domain
LARKQKGCLYSLLLPIKKLVIGTTVAMLLTGAGLATTPTTTKHPTAKAKSAHKTSKRRHSRKGAWKRHGQQKIDAARATEIQQALIREKYLEGQPNGKWDTRTETAMARYQADNGWQSKVTPDSRALIKLGLGPRHESDLNLDAKPGADALASTSTTSSTTAKQH